MPRYKNIGMIFMLTLIISLTACGGSSVKSEADISEDIQVSDGYFGIYGLTVDTIEISKRQTNDDEKTDYVWVTVEASNEDFSYWANYAITYVLYNDGWLLEDFWIEDSDYRAFHPELVTQEMADQAMVNAGYSDFELTDRSEDYDNEVGFSYSAYKTEHYLKTRYDVLLVYVFSPDTSWDTYYLDEYIREQTPDVIGQWRYTHYRDNGELYQDFNVNITDLDTENDTISLEYSFIGYRIFRDFGSNKHVDFSSSGVITVPLVYDENSYIYGENIAVYNADLPKSADFESYDDPPEITLFLGGLDPNGGSAGVKSCYEYLEKIT